MFSIANKQTKQKTNQTKVFVYNKQNPTKLFTGDDDVNDDDGDDTNNDYCHLIKNKQQLHLALRCHQQNLPTIPITGRSLMNSNGQLAHDATAPTVINLTSNHCLSGCNSSNNNGIGLNPNTQSSPVDGSSAMAAMSPTSSASSTSLQQQHLNLVMHHQHAAVAAYQQQQQLHHHQQQQQQHLSHPLNSSTSSTSSTISSSAAAAAASNRRDHNIDYSTLFVQLSGTLPTLYRCVSCNKIVSNRWHHANIHRPQSHECPVCGQKFTRRDNMKAHCKIKHADIKDRFFSHYVHM